MADVEWQVASLILLAAEGLQRHRGMEPPASLGLYHPAPASSEPGQWTGDQWVASTGLWLVSGAQYRAPIGCPWSSLHPCQHRPAPDPGHWRQMSHAELCRRPGPRPGLSVPIMCILAWLIPTLTWILWLISLRIFWNDEVLPVATFPSNRDYLNYTS